MACGGCRRNRKKSGTRVNKQSTTKKVTIKNVFPALSDKELISRKKKCSRCPFNTESGLTGRCKKSNRVVKKAIGDSSFRCPIKRF